MSISRFFLISTAVAIPLVLLIMSANKFDFIAHIETIQPYNVSYAEKLLTIKGLRCTGLGNAMFQYASLLGIAKKIGRTPVFTTCHANSTLKRIGESFFNYEKICGHSHEVVPPHLLSNWFETTVEFVSCAVNNGSWLLLPDRFNFTTNKLEPSYNYVIQGFNEQLTNFHSIRDLVRKEFRLKPLYAENATSIVDAIRQNHCGNVTNCRLIGVHMRRGDKVKHIDKFWRTAGIVYIQNAMRYYEDLLATIPDQKIVYLLLGDDYRWNAKWLPKLTDKTVVLLKPLNSKVDLRILTLCDHLILNVGTFSFWAGYLSNATSVVYPTFYAQQRAKATTCFTKKPYWNYCLPDWIAISRCPANISIIGNSSKKFDC